ncbi:transcriptional enhancer factor TEF-4 isoform X3 [Erinaceus europaeus]|uniref:Transcriptional enhancer factor TEF-4 isoform X3 n=1 Tax=Erinaceus europaeus TaxID=9365 RepID=A0ABM3W1Q6_ERIEU|nr:transcriptional enhancer factor TEF-4 isoform X3 [Erinaceus europaeus]
MGEPRTGAPLDDGSGWTGSEEGSEEGTGGSEGAGGDGGPDAEGVWSPDIEQSFQEALAIYPPCGRRKIILSDEGKMYGRNELIARYIKLRTGKTRTRKQVSSHIQVLARRKSREIQSKLKDQVSKDKAFQTMATMSSAQLISAPSLQAKLAPAGPQASELFQFWSGGSGPPWNVPDVKPFSQTPFSLSLTPPSADLPGYEPPQTLSPPALPPPAPSPPAWQARALGTARLQLVEFSAFVEPRDAVDSYQRHLFVHISQHCPSPGAPPLESVDVRQIYDKFPEKKGGLRELYDRGPPHAFFLVKFWADLNWGPSGEEVGAGGSTGGFYGVSSQYESLEHMTLTCSSKVCSFGKQVVEKVEWGPGTRTWVLVHCNMCAQPAAPPPGPPAVSWHLQRQELHQPPQTERAQLEDGRFVYRLPRSPMCEYLVNFLHKLRQLPERYMMNSVLENFTILQVVTNRDTQELLLCTAYVFEVSTSERGAQHHIYRLVRD